ncbi:MAG: sulfatase [Planctomycetota bacterium]
MRVVLLLLGLCSVASASEGPNVVLVVADDLGAYDLGCTGSTFYETPRIDGIAAGGVTFTRAYASCQVCSPSRASLMLGTAPPRHGITDYIGAKSGTEWRKANRYTPLLPPAFADALPAGEVTVAGAFREAGYRTFYAGKWHLMPKAGSDGLPTDHGFDVNVGGHAAGTPPGGYFSPYKNKFLPDGPPGESLPVRLGAETARFIKENADRPFFAVLAFHTPHGPIQTERSRWAYFREKAERAGLAGPADRFEFDGPLPVRTRQDHPVYAGMLAAMDDAVGVVLDQLKASGLEDETVVVFTSDHGGVVSGDGYSTSNGPLRGGKGRQWEGGLRVPLLVRGPGVPTGTSDVPTINMDLYPTLLSLCGLPGRPGQHVDGVDVSPVFRGGTVGPRPLFWHYPHYGNQGGDPSGVVRLGDFKLVRYYDGRGDELYDLAADPGERHDVSGAYRSRAGELGRLLDEWLAETGAKFPTRDPEFDAAAFRRWNRQNLEGREPRLERAHAGFLRPGWRPNATWWGSQPADD